jgi:C4-dicarboxylate-specific signal transduction histidine kinase
MVSVLFPVFCFFITAMSVADTGRGIDPENYARLFERFCTAKGDKGTGLGLWLCNGIVGIDNTASDIQGVIAQPPCITDTV